MFKFRNVYSSLYHFMLYLNRALRQSPSSRNSCAPNRLPYRNVVQSSQRKWLQNWPRIRLLQRKTTGAGSTKNLYPPFEALKKCKFTWPMAVSFPTYRHHRHPKTRTMFRVHIVAVASMSPLQSVTFRSAPHFCITNRSHVHPELLGASENTHIHN